MSFRVPTSSSSDSEPMITLQTALQGSDPTSPSPLSSKIPLLRPTVYYLRQAIRTQAEVELPSLRTSGQSARVYEAADVVTLKRAADTIKAYLDDVLDLEVRGLSPEHHLTPRLDGPQDIQESKKDYKAEQGSAWVGRNPLGSASGFSAFSEIDEDDDENGAVDGGHARTPYSVPQENTGKDRSSDSMDEGETRDSTASVDSHDSHRSNDIQNNTHHLDNKHPTNDVVSKSDTSNNDRPHSRHSLSKSPPRTPPASTEKPPKTPPPGKESFLSKLSPSRLLNMFVLTPSPTPAKVVQRSASPSTPTPQTPNQADKPVVDPSTVLVLTPPSLPFSNRPPAPIPLYEESSSSEDELHSPVPTSVSASKKRPRAHSLLPSRRSTRTLKPRTSTRLAQMVPPNLRAAGSMGPYKTLPGPRWRSTGEEGGRGRSTVRFSAVVVSQKRSGSASSVSSVSSLGSDRVGRAVGMGGGGGGAKRVRFEGFAT
ncbi:MAG: hypothetical protein LQ338_006489 [Usnochroma carphineum]|nr:MAG: hypothetical protein LQ338_006489 [Usnochroma carphineum]